MTNDYEAMAQLLRDSYDAIEYILKEDGADTRREKPLGVTGQKGSPVIYTAMDKNGKWHDVRVTLTILKKEKTK